VNGRDRDPPDEGSDFENAMGDVRRLADDRRRSRAGPLPQARVLRRAREPVAFVRPDPEQPRLGYAPGLDRRTFRQLRRGRLTPELTLDLHGMRRARARTALQQEVRRPRNTREVLLVVHGRGHHSSRGPVLRAALAEWLAEPAIAEHVLAFAPARAHDGGAGATLLLLRAGSDTVDRQGR